MSNFDEYIRQGEPGRSIKAAAWQAAIGLQDVDGLKPSPYLIDTAKRHIEGDVTIEEVKGLIDTYYKSRQGRLSVEEERTEEADKVSARITELLHVDYPAQSDTSSISKGQNDTLNVTLEERAVLNLIITNPKAKQTEIAAKIGKSDRTVKRIMDSLKEKGVIYRRNGKRDGWWDVLVEIPEAQ